MFLKVRATFHSTHFQPLARTAAPNARENIRSILLQLGARRAESLHLPSDETDDDEGKGGGQGRCQRYTHHEGKTTNDAQVTGRT